jgi:hypothetical protein
MHICGTMMEMEVKVFATNQAHENQYIIMNGELVKSLSPYS